MEKTFVTASLTLLLLHPLLAQPALEIEVSRPSSRPANQASSQNFTGSVRVTPLFAASESSTLSGGLVTFQPGARSHWHTHPLGQTLLVTEGTGRVQAWGKSMAEIRTGDVVRIPAGIKHWHGAAPQSSLTHIALQQARDGKNVEWLESVTEEQYTTMQPDPTIDSVSPSLEKYRVERIEGDLWKRPQLSSRDRSLVTVAFMIARNQTQGLDSYLYRALDHGVKPAEISETITHLAFYSGWQNALSASPIAGKVFAQRAVKAEQLPAADVEPLPQNQEAESQRATTVKNNFGETAPGLVQYTTDVLFNDLWLRPDLAPRDRSLITVAALISSGQVAQIPYHLHRAMDNGLTQEQAAEVITHLAFYAGWPNAFSALPVAKEVFAQRGRKQ